jgi:hypothetical protein
MTASATAGFHWERHSLGPRLALRHTQSRLLVAHQ